MRKACIAFDIRMMYVMSDQNRTLHQMISILYAFLWACQTMSEKQTTASNKSTCQKLIHCMRACVVFYCKTFFHVATVAAAAVSPIGNMFAEATTKKCCHKQRVVLQTIWQLKIVFNFVYRFFFPLFHTPECFGFGKFQPDPH